jgi:hypothetical protein
MDANKEQNITEDEAGFIEHQHDGGSFMWFLNVKIINL